jgi:hypothetical protein
MLYAATNRSQPTTYYLLLTDLYLIMSETNGSNAR